MFEQVGHHVEKIKRIRYGPLELDVELGEYRNLKPAEVAKLKSAAKLKAKNDARLQERSKLRAKS
jgi:23S rRNA pseudouridine2605 synthase